MFGIGTMEIVVILVVLALLLVPAVVALVVIVFATKKNSNQPHPDLFPCPSCGRLISRLATACPQCGRPFAPAGQK